MKRRTLNVMMALIVACTLGALLPGCRTAFRKTDEQVRIPKEAKVAVAAAISKVQGLGWKRFEINRCDRVNGYWEVDIWRIPIHPGGMVTVIVCDDSKVVRVIWGM
jgi:hypothetical protein